MGIRYFRFIVVLSMFLAFILLSSCLDKIDFDVPDGLSNSLVIDARLTKGSPSEVVVQVTNVFDFNADARRLVTLRSALLLDEGGNKIALEQDDLTTYRSAIDPDHPLKIDIGSAYKIQIETVDGRTFESKYETLLPVAVPEKWTKDIVNVEVLDQFGNPGNRRKLEFYISTPLSTDLGTGKYLWEFQRTFRIFDSQSRECFVTENNETSTAFTFDGTSIIDDRLDNLAILQASIDARLQFGSYFSVFQSSLTPAAFEYWDNVGQLFNRTGNMFDPQAAKINSNFEEVGNPNSEVFGFFFATETVASRVYVDQTDVGTVGNFCQLNRSNFCFDCLSAPNSTTEKPNWWQ